MKLVFASAASWLGALLSGCSASSPPGAHSPPSPAAPDPCGLECASTPTVAPTATGAFGVAPPAADLQLGWPTWVGIVCDDLPAQRRFYREVLGLTERRVGEDFVWFDLNGKLLELFAKSARPQYAERGVAIGFVVDDLPKARALLLARGVEPVSEIEGDSEQSWAYFRDGEGNLFELVKEPR